ncbi:MULTISPECIES: response regulator [Paenibacillus]|nr:response regulator [Paenibacillus gorillae]
MEELKVMIVDDAAFMRKTLRAIIENIGHQVIAEAENGVEAIRLFKLLQPDLITMDITMPEMDGISAVKEIKAISSDIKIIMCSAMGQRALIIEALQAGANDFIVKPFHSDRIAHAIEDLMSR